MITFYNFIETSILIFCLEYLFLTILNKTTNIYNFIDYKKLVLILSCFVIFFYKQYTTFFIMLLFSFPSNNISLVAIFYLLISFTFMSFSNYKIYLNNPEINIIDDNLYELKFHLNDKKIIYEFVDYCFVNECNFVHEVNIINKSFSYISNILLFFVELFTLYLYS